MSKRQLYKCRLCLENSEFKFSIFVGSLLEQIETLTSIKINKNDTLPSTCCELCLSNLHTSYQFQQRIIKSDKILHQIIEIEDDEGMPEEPFDEACQETFLNDIEATNELCCNLKGDQNNDTAKSTRENDTFITIYQSKLPDLNLETNSSNSLDNEDVLIEFRSNEIDQVAINCNSTESLADKLENKQSIYKRKRKPLSLECEDCNEKFENRRLYNYHMSKHNVKTCSICGLTLRADNFSKHFRTHSDPPEICEICGKTAKNKESLRGHMYYQHSTLQSVKCEECNIEFRYREKYKKHVQRFHLNAKDHQCHLCGNKFRDSSSLKKHISMKHFGERPHICPYCKKGFSAPYALKTHIRQHTNETPYRCEICADGFRQKVSLITHLKSKHDICYPKKQRENQVDC